MNKKKYKYENSTVFMVIAILAMFIAFPPLARMFYPEEVMEQENEVRLFLYCSKEDKEEGFSVSSSVYYLNDEPQKNTINFFDLKATANTDPTPAEINPGEESASEIIVLNRADTSIEYKKKSIFAELEFFRNLQGVNFVDNRTSYSAEVTNDSLIVNEGNEELKNYLLDIDSQDNFYVGLGYTCRREGSNS